MTPPRHILTILAVDDLDRSVAFYRAGLGWSVQEAVPVYVELSLPGGGRLGLYQRESFAKNTGLPTTPAAPGSTTGAEIYLLSEDLDADIRRLEGAGATCLSPRALRPWGAEAAYYADPDGNVLVLSAPAR